MIKAFCTCFICIFLCIHSYAELPKDLDLEADYIRYINNNKILIASENVVLKYQNFTVTSDYFIYDLEYSIVEFPHSLSLYNENQNLHAEYPVSYTHLTLPTICSV